MGPSRSVSKRLYPERRFASFHRRDARFLFFSLVADLVTSESVVLDMGAGRGLAFERDERHMRWLSNLRGRVRKVIGVDPDPVVFENPMIDQAFLLNPDSTIPLPDASVDLIFSTYVVEHITEPEKAAAEIRRVLKPGGWFCACTPNKWGYVGMAARLVPNRLHARVLGLKGHEADEKYPTSYKMSTRGCIARLFQGFRNDSFIFNGGPGYNYGSIWLARFWLMLMLVLPACMGQELFIFVQKPE